MLGRKHRAFPPKSDRLRAIETLESRQLLSGGHFGPGGGFALHEHPSIAIAPSSTSSDVHFSIGNVGTPSPAIGDGWRANGREIDSEGHFGGNDDGVSFNSGRYGQGEW